MLNRSSAAQRRAQRQHGARLRRASLTLVMVAVVGVPPVASGADFVTLEDACRGRQLMIQGSIEAGDHQRFIDSLAQLVFADDLPTVQDPEVLWTVKLDSPGGDPAEAMKIGRLLRQALATTEVSYRFERRPDGVYDFKRTDETVCLEGESRLAGCSRDVAEAECVGACMLIWLGGAERRAIEGQLRLPALPTSPPATDYVQAMGIPPEWTVRLQAGARPTVGEAEAAAWLTWPERDALSAPAPELLALLSGCPAPLSSAEAMESVMTPSPELREALLSRAEAHRTCRARRVHQARADLLAQLQQRAGK